MSKPVLSDLFTFEGRRNRKSYVLFHLAAVAAMVFGAILTTAVTLAAPMLGSVLWVLYIAMCLALVVVGFAVTAQRIRDFGYSGCWVFLYLIPYVGFAASIALYFVPSNVGENKYGPSCIE
jgi:uncharacterized membrane protein YhaH (DUF805 family)